jgi:hypothetical protein
MPFLIIATVMLVIMGFAVLGWLQEKKRREAFQQVALELGLRYVGKDRSIGDRYGFLNALRQGDNRYAFNVLTGEHGGYPVQAFDYHYETHSTDSRGGGETHHHYLSFFILEQERSFPELRIYPEGLLSKLGQMLGFDDIDFESSEFSRALAVRSRDRKFAYDICHPRMMEYLLEHRDLSLEIEGRCVAMSFDRRLKPEDIPARLQQLIEIRRLFPEYLYRP